jgi:hypothetical protein
MPASEVFMRSAGLVVVLASAIGVLAACDERPPAPVPRDAQREDADAAVPMDAQREDADAAVPMDAQREDEDGAPPGEGPTIRCLAPENGEMITAAPSARLRVVGIASDPDGIASVTANGAAVDVDALGIFSVTITTHHGIQSVEFVATDGTGAESRRICSYLVSREWLPSGAPIPGALTTMLRRAGLDDGMDDEALASLDDVVRAVLGGRGTSRGMFETDLDARFSDASFRFTGDLCDARDPDTGLCGVESTFAYIAGSADADGPEPTEIDVVADGLRVAATFPTLLVRGRARGVERITRPGFDTTFDAPASIRFPDVRFDVDVQVTFADGVLRADTARVNAISYGSVLVDVVHSDARVERAVETEIAADLDSPSNTRVRDAITAFVEQRLDAVIASILATVDVREPSASLPIERLAGEAIPEGIAFEAALAGVETGGDGITFRLTVSYLGTDRIGRPSAGIAIAPASEATIPSAGLMPIAHRISERVLTAIAHELWRGGAFAGRLSGAALIAPPDVAAPPSIVTPDETTIALVSVEVPETVVVDALLPPVVLVTSAEGGGFVVRVMLGGVRLRAEGGEGPWAARPVEMELAATVELALAAGSGVDPVFVGSGAGGAVRLLDLAIGTDRTLSAEEHAAVRAFAAGAAWSIAQFTVNRGLPALPLGSLELPAELSRYGLVSRQVLTTLSPVATLAARQIELAGGYGPAR